MRASSRKGRALERLVATPAWAPVLSLESVDPPLHGELIRDFHRVVALLPPAKCLVAHAQKGIDDLFSKEAEIDACALARWAVRSFARFIFVGESYGDVAKELIADSIVEPVAEASWEWRKEIAVRGKADAETKKRAVEALLNSLRQTPRLWNLFGEKWTDPKCYSLLLQPFLLSPAINFGDVAVEMKLSSSLGGPEESMRRAHPFPIFERHVSEDVFRKSDGTLAAPANAQVIIFSSDLAAADLDTPSSTAPWPVFGAGPRACAGAHYARPLLDLVHSQLIPNPLFNPLRNHKYSGRHNDSNWTSAELCYFATTVAKVLLFNEPKNRTHP